MSNGQSLAILHITLRPMLGHDSQMSRTKFHDNRLIIDGEIDKKHALQIIVS